MSTECEEWTLQESGLIVHRGDLIEYLEDDGAQHLAAMVVGVSIVGFALAGSRFRKGEQVIAAKRIKNRRLPKPEELGDMQISASQVVRLLDRRGKIPLPPPVAKTQFSPFADENPWRVDTWMIAEEWKAVSRWYPYSLRSLLPDGRWYEQGRYLLRNNAYEIMKALGTSHQNRYEQHFFVIIHCTLQGRDGREKAVIGSFSLSDLLSECEKRKAACR